MPRTAYFFILVFIALCLSSASCARCGDAADEGPSSATSERSVAALPATPAAFARDAAALIPDNAELVVILRDWTSVLEHWSAIRDRLPGEAGTIGQIEADLRNTLGFDIDRPETLSSLGIAPSAGGVFAMFGSAVLIVWLENPSLFEERIRSILTEQPFAMRAEIAERTVEGVRLLAFAETEGATEQVTIGLYGNKAWIFPDVRADRVDEMVRASRGASGRSVADDDAFDAAVSHLDGYSVIAIGSLDQARAGMRESDREAMDQALGRHVIAGMNLRSDRIDVRLSARLEPGAARLFGESVVSEGADVGLGHILLPDTYAVARMTVRPEVLLRAARDAGMIGEEGVGYAGLPPETVEALAAAVGPRAFAALTRTRVVTLMRAFTSDRIVPGDMADALGAIVAVEIRDRDAVLAALDAALASSPDAIERFEDGDVPVYTLQDSDFSLLSLAVTTNLLVIAPERQRRAVLGAIADGGVTDTSVIRDSGARNLAGSSSSNGIYIDIGKILSSPVALTLNQQVPVDLMSIGPLADQLYIRMRPDDAFGRVDMTLNFGPVPTTP